MEAQPETETEIEIENENQFRRRLSKLLTEVLQSYDKEERLQELQTKYPDMSPDEVVDCLITIASRKATAVGGSTGAVTTGAFLTSFVSGGVTTALILGATGAEIFYLVRLQIELVLDISLLYGIEVEQNTKLPLLVGAGNMSIEALEATLKNPALVVLARILIRTLPRAYLVKYTLPVLSMIIGGGYNYVTVKALGQFAKSYLHDKGKLANGNYRISTESA